MNSGRLTTLASAGLVLAMLAGGAWALTHLAPGQKVATHFDASGRPNGWAPAGPAFLLLPAIGVALMALAWALPKITPRGENLTRSPAAYGSIWMAVIALLAGVQALILASALGVGINVGGAIPALTGGLFILIGNVLPKLRWNYVVGIRTPWTLADERVWDKTHRFGGWVLVLAGAVMLIGGLIPPYTPKPGLVAGMGGLAAILTVGKSYLLWRDGQPRNGETGNG